MKKVASTFLFALWVVSFTACGASPGDAGGSGSGDHGGGGGDGAGGGGQASDCGPGCDILADCLPPEQISPTCEADCEDDLAGSDRAAIQACLDCMLPRSCDALFPDDGSASACQAQCGFESGCTPTDPRSGTVDQCAGETICIDSACEATFGRFYTIVIDYVQLNERDDNGEAWDVPGGLPDPFVEVTVNDTVVGTTAAVSDTTYATYGDAFDTQLAGGSTLVVAVWDEDSLANDFAFGCQWAPLDAAVLRGGQLYCESDTGNIVQASIFPR